MKLVHFDFQDLDAYKLGMDLLQHTSLPDSSRDQGWEKKLFGLLANAHVTLLSDSAHEGPDGLPYFLVETKSDSKEPFTKVVSWLAEKGMGLVLNPNKAYPDYIFPFGMLWNFKERSEFLTDAPMQASKTMMLEKGDKILAGAPHPQYLPDYVRTLMRDFFLQQGVLRPRILVIGKGDQFDLCFSLESLGRPPEKEHQGILMALSWFFPQHYSLALMSEEGLPPFIDL